MSMSAWIEVKYEEPNSLDYSSVIADLLRGGWTVGFEGQVMYLPAGDRDDFDWKLVPLEEFDAMAYLAERSRNLERIGLTATFTGTQSGGDFLASPGRLSFSITTNPILDRVTGLPDLTWYLQRILPALRYPFSRLDCVVMP